MANPAETAKNTVEKMSTATNVAFKDGVEKSMAAMTEMNALSKKNMEAVVASATATAKAAEALSAQAMAFSKTMFDSQVTAAKSLASAKSVQELVELQTTFAKSAMETYMSQFGKMSETMSASVKESMKPINERVAAVVEKFQAVR